MHPQHPHDVPATPHMPLMSNSTLAEGGNTILGGLARDMGARYDRGYCVLRVVKR
jgi:hypothetical protein